MWPRILVLLPVHNRRATTELFITCLLAQTFPNWHLVLIDDGSTDGTESMVRSRVASVTVLRGGGNWWWGGALHQGYLWLRQQKLSDDELVLIANDDTQFEPDFLANGLKAMKPRSLLLAQLYDQAGNFEEAGVSWDWRRFDWRAVKTAEGINCFSTRGLFLWARDFLEIGGFHPVLLPHYLSDYEFTMRAHRKGFALITAPEVFLRYDQGLTGIRTVEGVSVFERIRKLCSIKSANNPVYWTSFVLLACPWRYVPRNLVTIWKRMLGPLIMQMRLTRLARRSSR